MTDTTKLLDDASQKLADARLECLELGVLPVDIAKIMMDEAVLALMASGLSMSDVQSIFKKYGKRDLPRFYAGLMLAAGKV